MKVYNPMNTQDEMRFWSKVEKTDTCWLWRGTMSNGNAVVFFNRRTHYAVRVAWQLERGVPPPPRVKLCRTCDNPLCVRPDHRQPLIKQPKTEKPKREKVIVFPDMPQDGGVYYILNTHNNRIYVGETQNVQFRLTQHRSNLLRQSHSNINMRLDWEAYGAEAFEFGLLVVENDISRRKMIEHSFITLYQSYAPELGYNSHRQYLFDLRNVADYDLEQLLGEHYVPRWNRR